MKTLCIPALAVPRWPFNSNQVESAKMGFQPRILNYAFLVVANLMTSSCLQIWNGTSQLPSNMTMACKRVLMTNISCNALYSISDVTTRLPSNATDLGNHCSGNCNGSLEVSKYQTVKSQEINKETNTSILSTRAGQNPSVVLVGT